MSAESKTEPGGYYTYPQALEQFHVSDERKAVEVEKALKALGREPVWEGLGCFLRFIQDRRMKTENMERYNRQIILPGNRQDRTEKLSKARVLIVGVRGFGSPIASIWQVRALVPSDWLMMMS